MSVTQDDQTITVSVPLRFRRHGGRKMVVTPDGSAWEPQRPRMDNALVKALARAFRWQRMLDDGVCGSIEELAKAEKVGRAYVSRILRLTLLAPEIVETILNGRQPERLQLDSLLEGFPVEWETQRELFGLLT